MFKFATKKQEKWLIFIFAISLILPIALISLNLDNDLWFMLNHGRYILKHGFANVEPFTVHEGLTFSFEKWLTCEVFWVVYDHFGYWGMHLLIVGLGVVILLLAMRLAMIVTENNFHISVVAVLLACVPLYISFVVTRPQVFSYIALLLTMICLEKYVRGASWAKSLIFLPFISLTLMQFHSTMWLGMLIIMLPYMCDFGFIRFWKISPGYYRKFPIWIAAWASFLAGFINPYGFRSIKYTVVSLLDNSISPMISELQKTSISQWQILIPVIVVYLLYMIKGPKELKLRYLLLGLGTLFMSLIAVRNISFLLIGAIPVMADMMKDVHLSWKNLRFLGFLMLLVPAFGVAVLIQDGMDISSASKSKAECTAAIDWLADHVKEEGSKPSETRLYTSFNDGAYGEFKGFKCYLDPRAEVFIYPINEKGNIFTEAFQFEYGQLTYYDMQCAYDFDYMLVAKSAYYYNYMSWDENAKQVYSDDSYVIFDMRDYPITESDDNYKGIVALTEEEQKKAEGQNTKKDNTPDVDTSNVISSKDGISEIEVDNETIRVNTNKNAFDYSKFDGNIEVKYIDALDAYYYYDEESNTYYYYGDMDDMKEQGYIDDEKKTAPSSIQAKDSENVNNLEENVEENDASGK